MVKKQSTASGFTILGFAGIANKVLAILYVPVLTLLIGDMGNGIYNAGYQIYLLVFVITNSGIPVAISKLVSEQVAVGNYSDSYKTLRISRVMLISFGIITSVLTAVFARALSNYVGRPEAYLTILSLSPTMFFTSVACTYRGYFQGRSNMTPTGVSQIIEQVINSVLTVVFAWIMLRYGIHYAKLHNIINKQAIRLISVEFAAAGGTIGTSVGAMGSSLYLVRTYHRNKREILREARHTRNGVIHDTPTEIAKKIIQYAVPITIGAAIVYFASFIDLKFTNERLLTAGYTQSQAAALYGILTTQYGKITNIPLSLAAALAAAIIPSISTAAARRDFKMLSFKINESVKAILLITIPSAVGLAVLARPIIAILFPRNISGDDLMIIGSCIVVLISLVQVQTAILQGFGKTYLPTIHMILALIVKIIINYNLIAIKSINIKGAVIGSIVCYLMAAVLNQISIRKFTKVRLKFRKIFNRPLISSVVMGFAAYFTYYILYKFNALFMKKFYVKNALSAIIAIVVGCVVYFIMMLFVKGITAHDIKRLPKGERIINMLIRSKLIRSLLNE